MGDLSSSPAPARPSEPRRSSTSIAVAPARPSSPSFDRDRVAAEIAVLGAPSEAAGKLLGRPTPCIGRGDEIAMLLDLFARSASTSSSSTGGSAHAAILSGPPGVGKSRIAVEFLREAKTRAPSAEILFARGDSMSAGSPFGMLAQLVRREAGVLDGEPAEESRTKLSRRVARTVATVDVPRVSEFLGALAKIRPDAATTADLRELDPDALLRGDQMRRAWVDFLAAECDAHPVILVLEDLHWGDFPTVSLVDTALRVLEGRRLFVVAVARPEVHYLFPQLWSDRGARHVSVEALSRSASETLVRALLGADADPAVVAEVAARAAGNAFHLEELIRAVAAGGPLHASARAMIETRLAEQEHEARRTLRAASVFGQVFWRGGVIALMGGSHRGRAVRAALDDLAARELIALRPSARFPYEDEYIFRHALIQEAAYASLAEDDRASAHLLAGEWLERMGECEAMVLAEHFERARAAERAIEWYLAAAEHALAGNDLESAVERAERGIERGAQGETLGSLRAIQAEALEWRGSADDALRCSVEAMLALREGSTAWYRPAATAVRSLQALGDEERLLGLAASMRAALPRYACPPPAVSACLVACMQLYFAGLHDSGDTFFERIERVAWDSTEPSILARFAQARAVRGLFGRGEGDLPDLFARAAAEFERVGDLRNSNNWIANLGYAYLELGAYAEAERALRDALARALHLGLENTAATCRHNLGLALARRGALSEARAVEQAALARYLSKGDLRLETASRIYLALIHAEGGALDEAAAEAQRAVAAFPTNAPVRVHALAALAHIELARGRAGEALSATCEGLALLDAITPLEGGEALLRLSHAEALLGTGHTTDGRAAIFQARDHLLARAARIANPTWRRSFLENVPENARILVLAAAQAP